VAYFLVDKVYLRIQRVVRSGGIVDRVSEKYPLFNLL